MFDYFRNYSSNAHHICCKDSPTKGLYDHCQSVDLDLHSRSELHPKLDYFFNLQYIGQYLRYYIQTWHDGRHMDVQCMSMLVWVTLTLNLMQGHSGLAKAKNQRCMLSATKQVWISIKLATTVGHFLRDLNLDFENMYIWLVQLVFVIVVVSLIFAWIFLLNILSFWLF